MAFNTSNYLFIAGGDSYRPGDFYVQERECNADGTPGKVVTFADGNGEVEEVAKSYIKDGFDPKKIIINGQPATDVFEKSGVDKEEKSKKKSKLDTPEFRNFARAMMAVNHPGLYLAAGMYRPDITTPEKVN